MRGGCEATLTSIFSWALWARHHRKNPSALTEPQASVPRISMLVTTVSTTDTWPRTELATVSKNNSALKLPGRSVLWSTDCQARLSLCWKGNSEEISVKSHFTFGMSNTEKCRNVLTKGSLTQKSASVSCETWAVANSDNYGLILFMAWFGVMLVVSLELGQLTPAEKVALYVEYTMPGHLWLLEAAETASAAGQLSAGGIKQLRSLVTGYGHFHPHSWLQFSPGLHWSLWMNGCAKRGTWPMCSHGQQMCFCTMEAKSSTAWLSYQGDIAGNAVKWSHLSLRMRSRHTGETGMGFF